VTFTKKTLKAIKKALRARKKLVATVVVTSKDSASKLTRKTVKITIKG
jgi:VCBS repeat-containing protein